MGAAGIFSACSPKGPKFQGVDLTGAEYGRDLPLTDQFGKERSIRTCRQGRGGVLGYT